MNKQITYTISARGKYKKTPIDQYLAKFYPSIPIANIDSIFGFVEPTTLYSGRPYLDRQLSDKDYELMQAMNIGIRLPLTNYFCSEKEYIKSKPLLEKYHKKGNSVIISNDKLAGWIRKDFPDYQLEASILKNINSLQKISKSLKIYDTIVLPMEINLDFGLLEKIEHKDRITLFGNAGCAFNCANRKCYGYLSRKNKILTSLPLIFRYIYFIYEIGIKHQWCTKRSSDRKLIGITNFDLDKLANAGFSRFKLLRENKIRNSGY